MKKLPLKKIGLGLLVILVILQFFQIDKTNPESDPAKDLIAMTSPSEDVKLILEKACYDCHSNQTEYPWYTSVAPVSWWIKDHIDHGKGHLNFSEWGDYSVKKQDHKLEELIEEVEEGEMPLDSYTWVHGDARLSDAQKKSLMDWAAKLRKEYATSL